MQKGARRGRPCRAAWPQCGREQRAAWGMRARGRACCAARRMCARERKCCAARRTRTGGRNCCRAGGRARRAAVPRRSAAHPGRQPAGAGGGEEEEGPEAAAGLRPPCAQRGPMRARGAFGRAVCATGRACGAAPAVVHAAAPALLEVRSQLKRMHKIKFARSVSLRAATSGS